jgi:hypothetical protein
MSGSRALTGCSRCQIKRRQSQSLALATRFDHALAPSNPVGLVGWRSTVPLDWDPAAEKFVGPRADKGNAMISREMRSPWRLEV